MKRQPRLHVPQELDANWKGRPLSASESDLSYKYHVARLRNLYVGASALDNHAPTTVTHPPPWATTVEDVRVRTRERLRRQLGPSFPGQPAPPWNPRFHVERSLEDSDEGELLPPASAASCRVRRSLRRPKSASAATRPRARVRAPSVTMPVHGGQVTEDTAIRRRRRPQSAGGRIRSDGVYGGTRSRAPEGFGSRPEDGTAAKAVESFGASVWDEEDDDSAIKIFRQGPDEWLPKRKSRAGGQSTSGDEESNTVPTVEAIQACGAFVPLAEDDQRTFDAFVAMLQAKDPFTSQCLLHLAHNIARGDDVMLFYGGGL